MLERVITAGVGVVGLAVIGLGVASATVWRADDVLVATASASSAVVVTEPGVLELGGDPVTVRATTSGGKPVVLAVGRDTDVAAWVGTDEHQTVTGLAGWHDLALSSPATSGGGAGPEASAPPAASSSPSSGASGEAAGDEQAVPDPTDSDLWVAQSAGDGSAELEWPAQAGRWTLLAVAPEGGTPTLSMAWPRTVTTPWLWPCVVVGALLVLASAWWTARSLRRERRAVRWESVSTGALPQVPAATGAPMTRRQLREAEAAARARPRTGAIPRVRAAQPAADAAATPTTAPAPAQATATPAPVGPAQADATTVLGAPAARADEAPAARTGVPAEAARSAAPGTSGWTPTPAPTAASPSPAHASGARPAGPAVPVPDGAPAARPTPAGSALPTVALPSAAATTGGSTAPAAPADPAVPPVPATVGRPAWLARAPHHEEAAATGHGRVGQEQPTAPVPAPSGARRDDETHRPAWLPTTVGANEAPPTPGAPGGSRADAWRRAWGLPPLPTVSDESHAGTHDEEAGR